MVILTQVPPSGGSLEIGNTGIDGSRTIYNTVPPSGGSLEIGKTRGWTVGKVPVNVPPSGGSLEIGKTFEAARRYAERVFPLRGDP